jgi:hypothetical protein
MEEPWCPGRKEACRHFSVRSAIDRARIQSALGDAKVYGKEKEAYSKIRFGAAFWKR